MRVLVVKSDTEADGRRDRTAEAAAGGAAAAGGTGAAVAMRPTRARELSGDAAKVHRKLANSKRKTVKLSGKEWATVAGGRGNRAQQKEYTAQLARAISRGVVKPQGPTVRVYRDAVVQTDGAHRAHAAVLRGKKVKVNVESRSADREPAKPAIVRARRERDKRKQQRRLVSDGRMSRSQMSAVADRYSSWARTLNEANSQVERLPGRIKRLTRVKGVRA